MANIPKQRISVVTGIFMIAIAFIIDAAQFLVVFIPGVDVVLDFFLGILAIMIFGVWFFLLGVNYFSGSKSGTKLATMLTTAIIEAVPLVDALPGLTLGISTLIWATRKEDAEKIARDALPPTPTNGSAAINSQYTSSEYYMRKRLVEDESDLDEESIEESKQEELV
jgi:hypothetical protein